MAQSKLYIIGNGFDLHHGIDSRYSDFQTFLKRTNIDLYEKVVQYLCLDGNWADLENALAWFDFDSVMDNASNYLVSYAAKKWSDSYHHDYQFQIQTIVNALSSELKAHFINWIKSVEIPTQSQVYDSLLNVDINQKFLTFNYTATLQKVYEVSQQNIFHVHGSVSDSSSEIVIGHAWKPSKRKSLSAQFNPQDLDTRVYEGNMIIDKYFEDTFKPTEQMFSDNNNFFNSLTGISEIIVWGHSLSNVDMDYLQKIAEITRDYIPIWKVSYYGPNELTHHKNVMQSLGIDSSLAEYYELYRLV